MRCCLWTVLVVLLPDGINAACAAEPRALIEHALKAQGGVELVKKGYAVRVKSRGTYQSMMAGEVVEGVYVEDKTRFWESLHSTGQGSTTHLRLVSDGDKSWIVLNGRFVDLDQERMRWFHFCQYCNRVTGLVDLLTDKEFTLAPLPAIEVEGRPADGVKVSFKGQPEISLYFDRKTGLFVKDSLRVKRPYDVKEVLMETVLLDYREPDLASADEKIVREAKSGVSGPALLAFLRKRTPSASDLDRIRVLIRKLGDDAFMVREQASRDLIALGAVAVPLLREARKNNDREIVRRARDCLQEISAERSKTRTAAAIHLLGLRKPAGAAEVLLTFLPHADAELTREVYASLFAIARAKPEANPVLLRALEDKEPLRRQAAMAVLGKDGGAYARQPGRRLFTGLPKKPRKTKLWVNGKLDIEVEEFDFEFFNAVEDKLFAKP